MTVLARRALIASAIALFVLPARAAGQKVTMSVTSRTGTTAPYFIAIAKGYFADQDLDCTIVDRGGGVAISALIDGSLDFTMSAATSVGAIMRGAGLRVVYTLSDRPPYQLWASSPAIKTLADLKGKSVGVIGRGDTFELVTRLTLRDAGLPTDFLTYVPLGTALVARQQALTSGALPAVVLGRGDIEPLLGTPALAHAHMLVDMAQVIRMPFSGIATTARLLEEQPDLVKRFLRAVVQGVRYMRVHRRETVAILAKAARQLDVRTLELDYDDLIPQLTADGTASDDLIRKDLEVRATLLGVPPDKIPPIDQIYDYALVRVVNAELAQRGWKPAP